MQNEIYPKKVKEEAIKLHAEGVPYTQIAKKFNCSPTAVRYWCDPEAAADARRSARRTRRMQQMDPSQIYQLTQVEQDAINAIYDLAHHMSESGDPYEVDHIISVRDGGPHRIWNLRIVPRRMNRTGRPRKGE